MTRAKPKPKTLKLRCIVAVWPNGAYYIHGSEVSPEGSLLDLVRDWDDDGPPSLHWVNLEVPAPGDTGGIPTVDLFIPGGLQ